MKDSDSAAVARVMGLSEQERQSMPLRLSVAAAIAFPDGTMTAAGLRKERDRGRLVTEMIAGKEYTTLAEVKAMRELCRIRPRTPAATRQDGSSGTAQHSPSLAAALALAESLRKGPSKPPGTKK